MAKQTIGIGAAANDGTGDPLRTAFTKINDNFTELYASILPYVAKTANYTLLATDYLVECTANTFTILLPTAVGIVGKIYHIKNTGTGIITVDGNSSETIDSLTTQIVNQWSNLTIMSNGANWIII